MSRQPRRSFSCFRQARCARSVSTAAAERSTIRTSFPFVLGSTRLPLSESVFDTRTCGPFGAAWSSRRSASVMQKRVAVYARVSTADQCCEPQLLDLREYVAARGWRAVEFVDQGVSGARDRRPAL